ncbi:hypothetical protein [Absidia glauca]|uniref:Rab-GAP TBC domain-containing protein n=1 Tax=Absidia glauca TaxID=4829 RepID=A0A168R522_ABSGL|nr:hypothetical protein [Absidia glauca]
MDYSINNVNAILSRNHALPAETENSLMDLRIFVLHKAIPSTVSAHCYISLVRRGPSIMDGKIKNDTFRTMTTDAEFLEQVSEDMLIRTLNAFVRISLPGDKNLDTQEEASYRNKFLDWFPGGGLTYVQGMNVLVAPFLMVMPEMEAFFAFSTFMWRWCPLYIQPNLKGVHCGAKLLDMCLKTLDPQLYYLLLSKGITANVYAIPCNCHDILCLHPAIERITTTLGCHVCFWTTFEHPVHHCSAGIDEARLAVKSKLLRKLPPLQADKIIKITLASVKIIPPDLYDKLVRHARDESVAESVGIHLSAGVAQSEDLHTLPPYLAEALL